MSEERNFDIVLMGATGFTGRLVAEYLLKTVGVNKEVRWALAGRNFGKLEKIRHELGEENSDALTLELLQADSHDFESLVRMVKQTKVVCTTVGPYALYGSELVRACVQEGTDYCDLAGEVQWIREMIDTYHDAAVEKGAKIVNCCGYDSIPSDLGTLMMQQAMKEKTGEYAEEVKYFAGKSKGTLSGGTIASMLNVAQEAKKKEVRRILGNPYGLSPDKSTHGPDGSDQNGTRFDEDIQGWTGPFVMAAINTRIVRRSNALMGLKYGKNFRYSEVMSFPKGFKGWRMATSLSLGLVSFLALAAIPPTRKLLQATVLPKPGEGPSREIQESGFFNTHLIAKQGERRLYGLVRGERDPGYAGTAIMLAQSALCLAKDRDKLPERAGLLTPASAMGEVLIDRLREAGMTFNVSEKHPFQK